MALMRRLHRRMIHRHYALQTYKGIRVELYHSSLNMPGVA